MMQKLLNLNPIETDTGPARNACRRMSEKREEAEDMSRRGAFKIPIFYTGSLETTYIGVRSLETSDSRNSKNKSNGLYVASGLRTHMPVVSRLQ